MCSLGCYVCFDLLVNLKLCDIVDPSLQTKHILHDPGHSIEDVIATIFLFVFLEKAPNTEIRIPSNVLRAEVLRAVVFRTIGRRRAHCFTRQTGAESPLTCFTRVEAFDPSSFEELVEAVVYVG